MNAKHCDRCGGMLMGLEERGETCNDCLDNRLSEAWSDGWEGSESERWTATSEMGICCVTARAATSDITVEATQEVRVAHGQPQRPCGSPAWTRAA